jgi:hypothetical protein
MEPKKTAYQSRFIGLRSGVDGRQANFETQEEAEMKKELITSFAVATVLMAVMAMPAAADTQQPTNPKILQILDGAQIHIQESTSLNWAGYAVEQDASANSTTGELYGGTAGVVTDVQGTWVVPSVTGEHKSTAYSSVWVGIDGYDSSTVEQIGTEQDSVHGKKSYYAWFEMYPNVGYRILAPVKPGDTMTAEVSYADGQFTLTITDTPVRGKRGWTFTITQSDFATPAVRDSAEWIVEAPSSFSGGQLQQLPLADFGTVQFSEAQATLGSTTGSVSTWPYDAITMEDGPATATPSALSGGGSSFSVTFSQS